MRRIADWIHTHAKAVVVLGLLSSAVAAYFSVLLYKNLRTEIEELLPTTARSIVDLGEVSTRLESIDNLAVLVFSKDTQGSKRFVTDLATRLSQAPPDVVASVEYRIDRELEFFKQRRPLYMELGDLQTIRRYIHNRIEYEKQLYNPLNIFTEDEIPEPRLDFNALRRKYDSKVSSYSRFPGGFYATPDETKRVVLVNIPGQSNGGNPHKLKAYVEGAVQELKPTTYASGLEIKYSGGVQNSIEEQAALVADLELSSVIVTIIVSAAMVLYLRSIRAALALLTGLFAGTLWTFGVSYFAVGYLNANSAFLGSIVLGNGVNFGIIFVARYLEERRHGLPHLEALRISMGNTAISTLTAALAAGLAYGSLVLTGFRGFRQFGTIGLIGMVLCWLATYTIVPALLTLLDSKNRPIAEPAAKKTSLWAEFIARTVGRFAPVICVITVLLSVAALSFLTKLGDRAILESDLSKLRNKKSMEEGSGYLSKYVDEIFQRYLSPTVILPRTTEEAEKIAAALREKKAREGDSSLIVSIQTIEDFLPKDQPGKIQALKEIRTLLPPHLLRRISPSDRSTISEFLTPQSMVEVTQEGLPPLILQKFTERNGKLGLMILVEPPLSSSRWSADQLTTFVTDLREIADSIAPGTPVAGGLPVSADLMGSIIRDGPRATLFAFLAVVSLLILLFRTPKIVSLVLFSLLLGVLWLGGLIMAFDLKINFLNFIALPITFGIGVDYGVNIFQRYREEGADSILKVIRETGGAVSLCSFTTVVGYGSLILADNQAFVSFGLLSILGELTCLFAAIFSLPAFLLWTSQFKRRVLNEAP